MKKISKKDLTSTAKLTEKKSSLVQNKQSDISVSIVGHNEEKDLEELLPSLAWAREIIYVDCESSDDSVKIAKKFKCRVFHRKNNLNININKQFGISQAQGSWVIYLDPDERLTEAGVKEIREMAMGTHNYQAFRMNRKNFVFDRFLAHGEVYPDPQLRLFKNGMASFPQKHIHEFLQVSGEIGKLKEDMIHYTYLSINQMWDKFSIKTSFEAGHMLGKGVKLNWGNAVLFIILKPIHMFILKFLVKRGFQDGYPGLIFAFMSALHFPIRYFKLWELVRKKSG